LRAKAGRREKFEKWGAKINLLRAQLAANGPNPRTPNEKKGISPDLEQDYAHLASCCLNYEHTVRRFRAQNKALADALRGLLSDMADSGCRVTCAVKKARAVLAQYDNENLPLPQLRAGSSKGIFSR
jgi:hypothetical protein